MSEALLAERIACEILSGGNRSILVRNVKDPDKLSEGITGILEAFQVLSFKGGNADPVRECLLDYFTGDGVPDPATSFEAGWRSHLTEIALVSSEGMECAAGLHSAKETLRSYLLEGTAADIQSLLRIMSSFSRKLPVLFCFINCSPFDELVSSGEEYPPVIALVSGAGHSIEADLVLDSGFSGTGEIRQILKELGCQDPHEDVFRITGGNAELVQLYAGIRMEFGFRRDSVTELLNDVFHHQPEMRKFACAAALLSPGFMPAEVASVSGTEGYPAFLLGRKIKLWQGHLVATFISETARKFVESLLDTSEKNQILLRASEAVVQFRGVSPVSLRVSGQLLASAGMTQEASEKYIAAGKMEEDQLLRASLFRTASALNPAVSETCLFQAALSLYRSERFDEASRLLEDSSLKDHSDSMALRQFCSRESSNISPEEFPSACPDISPVLLKSRRLHRNGLYLEAEKLLTEMALADESSMQTALVELGDQLFKRGLYEQSLCVMRAALCFPDRCSPPWIETKIRYILARTCNRTGRFKDFQINMERLMELALVSGDKRRLVSLYILFASSMLLRMEPEKALNLYRAALRTADREESRQVKAILNNISIAQRKLHRMDDALRTLMRLVRVCVSTGDLARASVAYGNMARLFIDLSRFESAGDCLETMIEFSNLSGKHSRESICYISAQIAFASDRIEDAMSLIDRAIDLARAAGSRRRLSLNLVKKGSMLLRVGDFEEASASLQEAVNVSILSNSRLNCSVASMKLTAAECFLGNDHPASLLNGFFSDGLEDTHKGEGFYWHWRLTGSRQSLTAAAQLLSTGLLGGLHHHSYLYMLQEITSEIPITLAAALPLVHNYPSCNSMKGD